ncbi:MAG TPA: AsmA-like C-terminal region-containing protein, partial [Segetibacter sp.]
IPIITCDIKTDFNLTQLNNVLESNIIELTDGKGFVDLTYSGPLAKNNNRNTIINGKIGISDGEVVYLPHNLHVNNVNTNIVFKNSDVFVNDFRGTAKGNKIMMNGSGKNLLALVAAGSDKVFVDWNIYSPSLNLGSFTSLLQKRTTVVKRRTTVGRPKLGNTAQNLDKVITQANFRLNVKADELIYSKFRANNVKASLGLVNQNWVLNNVSLQHAGGTMAINGYLNEKNNKYYEADVKVNVQNADVAKIMYAFNDFGQDGISNSNLRGKLFANVQMRMDIDRNLAGQPDNMAGFVDFNLKDGALYHYEPLQKIQKVAFKKRNFDEIYFAELKDRLDIKDKEIKINRMEIQSTVLTLFVEGLYSIKGNNTDISIQVPLSNLKSRDEDYVPENKGAKAKAGASVFMRGRPDAKGAIQFKLDLFRKFRKNEPTEEKKDEDKKEPKPEQNKDSIKEAEKVKKEEKKNDKAANTEDKKNNDL